MFASPVYLEVRFGHTYGDLLEQRLLDLLKVCRLNDVQDLFDFAQKHQLETKRRVCRKLNQLDKLGFWFAFYLFLAAGFGPEPQKPSDHLKQKQGERELLTRIFQDRLKINNKSRENSSGVF